MRLRVNVVYTVPAVTCWSTSFNGEYKFIIYGHLVSTFNLSLISIPVE